MVVRNIFAPRGIPEIIMVERLMKATMPYKDYRVDVKVVLCSPKRGCCTIQSIEPVPRCSTMILHASTYRPPTVESRCLISRSLGKGGFRNAPRNKNYRHREDISFKSICRIAKQQKDRGKTSAYEFKGTIKEVLGTAKSMGLSCNHRNPLKIMELLDKEEIEIPKEEEIIPYCIWVMNKWREKYPSDDDIVLVDNDSRFIALQSRK